MTVEFPPVADLLRDSALGRVLDVNPLVCIDIGSRGGFEPDLLPIAFAVDAVGFEPDPAAFSALADAPSKPWRSLQHLPLAVAGSRGHRTLHVPVDPVGASLLEHDERIGERFNKTQFFVRRHAFTVETQTLDGALAGAAVSSPAFLKLDVEGAELEILQAAPQTLEHVFAVKLEAAFVPFRRNQPLMPDLHGFLTSHGFVLMDILRPHRWRMNGDVIHPQAIRQKIPYSRGQLVQSDFLYWRVPATAGAPRLFQAAALAMTFGFFDHAAEILHAEPARGWLVEKYQTEPGALVSEASRRYGRALWSAAVSDHLRRLWTYARSYWALRG